MGQWSVSSVNAALLRKMTERLIGASTVQPGQVISAGENTTGRAFLTPGSNESGMSTYPAFWIRDPGWIAASGMIPANDVWGWITLMAETMQGHEPHHLASGGVILPYSIADHINVNGRPVFYPGTYKSDDTQGPPFGMFPPHDDQYWMVFNTYAYAKLTRGNGFRDHVLTPMGELPLYQVCELAHNAFPVDAHSQLCIAADNLTEHIVDWGYNDTISKTGKLLFPSLLRYESALKLSHLFAQSDMQDEALTYQQQATLLQRSIIQTFYLENEAHEGCMLSATGIGRKPDIWGSAYAVYLGVLPEELSSATSKWLLHMYRNGEAILHGQVRHIPRSVGEWEVAQCAPGTYQNGGYWAYPAGWYIFALSLIDDSAAEQMFVEFLDYQRTTWDENLHSCAWECINPALNHYQNPGYLATIALPYVTLRNKKLID
jgi:hypothetical protein